MRYRKRFYSLYNSAAREYAAARDRARKEGHAARDRGAEETDNPYRDYDEGRFTMAYNHKRALHRAWLSGFRYGL